MSKCVTLIKRDAMGRRIRIAVKALIQIVVGAGAAVGVLWLVVAQPTWHRTPPSDLTVEPARLRQHVTFLSETHAPRNWRSSSNLNACAGYIRAEFTAAGAEVSEQPFEVVGLPFRNVTARFGNHGGDLLIVGAHYDGCDETPGADDNASGVAALLELAHLLGRAPVGRDVELVAYTLEEPPFFRTEQMGSAVHARRTIASGRPILGMIALEMVGYYSDTPRSQHYPLPLFYLLYPHRGNFVGVIGRWDQADWICRVKRGMKGATDLPVHSIRAPGFVPGVDFSDHANYWDRGIPAVMVSDTAFYRNEAYHTRHDTADRLDYTRMSMLVVALREMIETL